MKLVSRVERDNEIRVEFSYIVFEFLRQNGKIAILDFFSLFFQYFVNFKHVIFSMLY